MRRWQDRGEVQDSDDEDLSLSNESQSPEQARKRPRLDGGFQDAEVLNGSRRDEHDEHDGNEHGADSDEELDEPWLQPKVATTYSRKVKAVEISVPRAGVGSGRVADAHNGLASGSLSPPPPPRQGEQASAVSSPTAPEHAEDDPFAGPGSSHSTDSDELPSASQLLFGRFNMTNESAGDQPFDRSATSSPLTEREVSPPPGFRLLGVNAATVHEAAPQSPVAQGAANADGALATDLLHAETLAAAGGRRQMRARKEIQLHPYQYDKTLFQQQWRQRGLKPVHFTVRKEATETQDRSYSGDESESQKQLGNHPSSATRPSSASGDARLGVDSTDAGATSQNLDSDEEFPDIETLLNRRLYGGVQDGQKRRKLFHLPRTGVSRDADVPRMVSGGADPHLDEFTVPPSPPPTSSDSAEQPRPRPLYLPSGFRLPAGMTPAPLPTPQVSSDLRPSRKADRDGGSDSESLPRQSRPSTVSRPPPRPVLVGSSSESEPETASEPEVDQRRLQREKKRIRGVLPASWLKIDFRAQQRKASPSPEGLRRLSTASPPPSARPQKGLAQRVSRGFATPGTAGPIAISDDGDDSDNVPAASRLPQQSRLYSSRGHLSVARDDTVDIDAMEVDWVDPMLVGPSRRAEKRSEGKKRQPRIKDAFARVRNERNDFSEERAGMKHALGSAKAGHRSAPRKTRQPRRSAPRAPALSILDAPSMPAATEGSVPQFVRLAQRQARRQTGQGRHSPSRKVIRLATKDDTDEATAVLRAWREGTIAPRVVLPQVRRNKDPGEASVVDMAEQEQGSLPAREVLVETDGNRQSLLPATLRNDADNVASGPRRRITVRRPQPRQTQLRATAVERQSYATEGDIGPLNTPLRGNRQPTSIQPSKRFHVQPQANRLRGAQIEMLENAFDQEHRTSAFELRINCLTESVAARARRPVSQALPLERFLGSRPILMEAPTRTARHAPERAGNRLQDKSRSVLPYRPRKRPPQHVDVEARQYRQPSEPLPEAITVEQSHVDVQPVLGPVLHGLGAFGTRYAFDFDVQPLALGTYFHQTTFIGSGDLAASLKLAGRDLSVITGRMTVHVGDEVLEWGAWTEDVAAGIARIPSTISEALLTLSEHTIEPHCSDQLAIVTSNVDHMLRSTVRYCSRCLAFLDPVDRRSCVQHLQRFVEDLLETIDQQTDDSVRRKLDRRCLQYAMVVATQAQQLSHHSLVQAEAKLRGHHLISEAAAKLARHLLRPNLHALRSFYEDMRHSSKREAGIQDDDGAIAGIVTLHHCLRNVNIPRKAFWTVIDEALDVDVTRLDSVSALDKLWYDLFTILPALEVDESGIARPGSRLHETQQDWTMIKQLMDRVFGLYHATSAVRGSTINDYVRAILTRCYRLITRWGWWKCEAILGTVFDFFARRGLAPLHNEQSRGSPRYLEELSGHPSLEAQPDDRSFNLFLKMLAAGLQGTQKHGRYADKKIGGIAWRFIPNHDRTYRKDADVRQADLDALRNHHDLLCTLYYASPVGHRLRLDLLRILVDHSTSHREACRLSVRSWSNLASFQASTDEPTEALQPFTDWFQDMLQTTITQYRLAQTEAEQDFAIAKAQGAVGLTESVLIATINSNQRQIAATLVDALAGLRRALQAARGLASAFALVEGSRFWTVFTPFDASERRLYSALQEALDVTTTALAVQRDLKADDESQRVSEESQDYGDSSALQEFAATQNHSTGSSATIADLLYDPVGQLVSNVFGADQTIDDPMLTKIVDLWVQLAKESVRSGKRSWTNYLDDYSHDSWHQLRDTEQRRKFTPYFLACVVNCAGESLEDVRRSVLSSWLVSLVEREAMLKYQHELTAALLNHLGDEPLLDNPPFSKDCRDGTFSVSLTELRQRRLTLISSVLSSMRKDFDDALYHHPEKLADLRRTYTDMLRSVMQAMKNNYQELQTSTSKSTADPNVHGAYVVFVQHVVSFLQEHTADICRVDSFFTDSSAFPLPATDPTYVVGRLKGYVPKLVESKTRKQLATFIHAVSERAAVDGQQQYLVDQLCSAMDGVLERGSSAAPSLRHVVLTAIFPAYIANALSTACSWILALPLLRVCQRVVGGLLYCVKLEDEQSVGGIIDTVEAVLDSMHKPLGLALTHPGLLRLTHVQGVLGQIFGTGQSLLTLCDHLRRTTGRGDAVAEVFDPVAYSGEAAQTVLWSDTKTFAEKQAQTAFESDWHAHEGQYFVRRGNSSKEVVVSLKDEDEGQQDMLASIEQFCESFEAIVGGRARMRTAALRDGCGMGGVMV
ncbi:hypothetical protein LTR36_010739 [Oleoguttula mirabilis]|uniref:Uncharacterized protein n=1 Tax=Oleoguttula mirabilis TaxID=1507867 RepID=A0AAV9JRD8_9PEZI|nr:hypothetical protein LTR36_010739 [Oleoguttula mirabilis]